jgi:nucleoside-triphosphatase
MAGLNLLITGRPGVGKTTLAMNVVSRLRGSLRLAGFTTAEVRDASGERTGFQIATVEGKQANWPG